MHADWLVNLADFDLLAEDAKLVGGIGFFPFLFSRGWRSEFISLAVGFAFHFDALFEVFLRRANGSAIQFSPVRELFFALLEDFVELIGVLPHFEAAFSRPLMVSEHAVVDFGGQLDLAEQLARSSIVGIASPLDRLALELLLARHRRWIGSHCVLICVSCSVMNSAMLPSNSSTSSRTERHDRKHGRDVNSF